MINDKDIRNKHNSYQNNTFIIEQHNSVYDLMEGVIQEYVSTSDTALLVRTLSLIIVFLLKIFYKNL